MGSPRNIKLQGQDVIHLHSSLQSLQFPKTFRADELIKNIIQRLVRNPNRQAQEVAASLRETGIECEILQADGKGWKKGKFRLSLEFIPDSTLQADYAPEAELEKESLSKLNHFRENIK